MSKQNTPCVPALMTVARGGKQVGDPCGGEGGMRQARLALIERDGPRPPGMVCRHTCENDSMAPNGFVCLAHTEWNTYSQNLLDQDPIHRWKRAKKLSSQPDHNSKVDVTCPHCGKSGQKLIMARWHFDNCKWRS